MNMRTISFALATLLVSTRAFAATPAATAPTKPFHLELKANPAAPFPYLGKLGTVSLHVYSGGVRAESLWLGGYSRNFSPQVVVENPLLRLYTEVPLAEVAWLLQRVAGPGGKERIAAPILSAPVAGTVDGVKATRYRMTYGAEAWIDVWTISSIPTNQQFRSIINEMLDGISPGTANVFRGVKGTPINVELNFSRFKKVQLLTFKKLTLNNAGEADALKVGPVYAKAPLLDSIWK